MPAYSDLEGRPGATRSCRHLLAAIAVVAFACGLTLGVAFALWCLKPLETVSEAAIRSVFVNNSNNFVSFIDNVGEVVTGGVYWGRRVEAALPAGYRRQQRRWTHHLQANVGVKLERGCGRMQNRLLVLGDGTKGCVRYRQNTDQIQGELFSYYLGQVLQLPNLAPSCVSVVDLEQPLWKGVAGDVAKAQWSANKPVVVTQYIENLLPAAIPQVFKPNERHLNKFDVLNVSSNLPEEEQLRVFVELAQWSDLIIFDYLTANLDRIVNNLYNYQWNVNIMDAPAHNLAKRADTDLLVFLDNESGLLHGYRLLKKYEVYHNLLLENLCVFRKSTADVIKRLREKRDVGRLLRDLFEQNSDVVKDLLPMLPDKSVKILNERIDKVYGQIVKCEAMFADET
ncbi:extracellular serine/threonine protein kinase four-jointed [Tribolium castaneum]|uniref:Protein four-jointed-like Protein n=1 Tax=Tribolium castaneum TaxID=7070 RepID=D2A589_TRICA|nr:PREDICTED: extracellular serine/threonine protein kinase four-jointed [Tribolium castaneum]EFA05328.1 Protein four-jointed-like Protein [Tribolium castaneum]|eukprot:XP_973231.1 PREDICTED: extracellular serine/threonine protein kinase four-jointed [Tribolium castaneum]